MLYFFKNFFNSSENVRSLSVYALYLVSQPSGGPWAKWVQIINMIHTEFALRYGCIISLFSDLALDIAPDNIAQGAGGPGNILLQINIWHRVETSHLIDSFTTLPLLALDALQKSLLENMLIFRILNTKGWWSSNCIFGTYIYLGFSIKIVLANS